MQSFMLNKSTLLGMTEIPSLPGGECFILVAQKQGTNQQPAEIALENGGFCFAGHNLRKATYNVKLKVRGADKTILIFQVDYHATGAADDNPTIDMTEVMSDNLKLKAEFLKNKGAAGNSDEKSESKAEAKPEAGEDDSCEEPVPPIEVEPDSEDNLLPESDDTSDDTEPEAKPELELNPEPTQGISKGRITGRVTREIEYSLDDVPLDVSGGVVLVIYDPATQKGSSDDDDHIHYRWIYPGAERVNCDLVLNSEKQEAYAGKKLAIGLRHPSPNLVEGVQDREFTLPETYKPVAKRQPEPSRGEETDIAQRVVDEIVPQLTAEAQKAAADEGVNLLQTVRTEIERMVSDAVGRLPEPDTIGKQEILNIVREVVRPIKLDVEQVAKAIRDRDILPEAEGEDPKPSTNEPDSVSRPQASTPAVDSVSSSLFAGLLKAAVGVLIVVIMVTILAW